MMSDPGSPATNAATVGSDVGSPPPTTTGGSPPGSPTGEQENSHGTRTRRIQKVLSVMFNLVSKSKENHTYSPDSFVH